MAPEHSETTRMTSRILVLCLSLIMHTGPVLADNSNELYNQLPISNTESGRLSIGSGLPDILSWKASLSDSLQHNSIVDGRDFDRKPVFPASKRVFCNGFTGCGGKFRNRRRQPENDNGSTETEGIRKRPFCNTYGCYNSGRKRSIQTPIADNLAVNPKQEKIWPTLGELFSLTRAKKLFCNGYGGCQNMGKRLVTADGDENSKLPTNKRPVSLPASKDSLMSADGKKRFYTSGFDDYMDELIDNMRSLNELIKCRSRAVGMVLTVDGLAFKSNFVNSEQSRTVTAIKVFASSNLPLDEFLTVGNAVKDCCVSNDTYSI